MGPEPDPTSDVPGMSLWGWMSPLELQWLGEQAAQMRTVVEIGSLHGRSSFALATACPDDGAVFCVDPWSDDGWNSWWGSMQHFPNVHGVRMPSPEAIPTVLSSIGVDAVDMVFIDGAHDYESVAKDILGWLPYTTKLLCGHDYPPPADLLPGEEPGFPDVTRAVNDLIGFENITIAPGTAIWAYRI